MGKKNEAAEAKKIAEEEAKAAEAKNVEETAAKKAEAERIVEANKKTAADLEAKKNAKPQYYVKAGKSLVTKKGIIGDREEDIEIKIEWLHGGEDTMNSLIEKGYVGENKG